MNRSQINCGHLKEKKRSDVQVELYQPTRGQSQIPDVLPSCPLTILQPPPSPPPLSSKKALKWIFKIWLRLLFAQEACWVGLLGFISRRTNQ